MAESATAPPADGAAFSFNGKDYVLPRLVQADRKQLHAVFNAWALRDVREMEPLVKTGDISAEDFNAAYSLAHARATGGYYWWDEPGGVTRRGTEEGFVRLCWICFKRIDPKMAESDVLAMARSYVSGRSVLDSQYALANADPTAPRPSAAGGGENAMAGSKEGTA